MKKVLSLAFIAAVLLLGCSADGFFQEGSESVSWGKQCKVGDSCFPVQSKAQCDSTPGGMLVSQSQCPQD